MVDRLNIKYGNWTTIKERLETRHPELLSKYECDLFYEKDDYDNSKRKVAVNPRDEWLKFKFCYYPLSFPWRASCFIQVKE